MALINMYLYRFTVDVFTEYKTENHRSTRYRRMYNRTLPITKGTDTRIEIRVRDQDQQLTSIQNTALKFLLVSSSNNELVFEKTCSIKDPLNGIAYIDLKRNEMLTLEEGDYNYSIVQEYRVLDETEYEYEYSHLTSENYIVSRSVPLFVDDNFSTVGRAIISNDVRGSLKPSITLGNFLYTNPKFLGEGDPRFRISDIVDANPWTTKPQKLHTFQFFFSKTYSGKVQVQASIETQGATPKDFFTVSEFYKQPDGETTVYKNVSGKFSWFRVKHYPDTEGVKLFYHGVRPDHGGIVARELGELIKILYR